MAIRRYALKIGLIMIYLILIFDFFQVSHIGEVVIRVFIVPNTCVPSSIGEDDIQYLLQIICSYRTVSKVLPLTPYFPPLHHISMYRSVVTTIQCTNSPSTITRITNY